MNDEQLHKIRHSLAHVLAAAVREIYPNVKFGIGPVIDDGFYYDFWFPAPEEGGPAVKLSPEIFPEIEKRMRQLIEQKLPVEQIFVPIEQAMQEAKTQGQKFKLELLEEIKSGERPSSAKASADEASDKIESVSVYTIGNFSDVCKGPHVKNTKELPLDSWKLDRLAGAYWKGDEKNPQLQRIYALAFGNKKELDKHIALLEEAKKRDHKKLGPQLGLFMFHETAPGMPYWLPRGMILLNQMIDFWRTEHAARGYQEISSPLVNKKELWETSGHWEHYRDDMFIANMGENEVYGIKPMNCPNAMIVFGSESRSYRDLPLRLSDTDTLHRYERSGVLNGLLRVRSFRQDDSHNFVTEGQIAEEYSEIFDIAEKFYGIFNLKYSFRLGTRPEKFLGDIKTWDKAELALKNILKKKAGDNYTIAEGDGAFYGPKVDIIMKDFLGREWQMGTIQLDFQLPQRFNLSYIDEHGKKQTPIVIHRVIYGSLDRFIGILIEHFAGAFPLWLAPVQATVVSISDKSKHYAEKVEAELKAVGIRAELDERNESVGKKIREAELQKVPYILVVGEKEAKAKSVAVRERGKGDGGMVKLDKLIKQLSKEIADKK